MLGTGDGRLREELDKLPEGTLVNVVPQRAGLELGLHGISGEDKPSQPNAANVVIPAWKFYGAKVFSSFITTFFTIMGFDGTGIIAIAHEGDIWGHIWKTVTIAAAPALLMLLWDLKRDADRVISEGR